MIQFDSYFSRGLKPPTRSQLSAIRLWIFPGLIGAKYLDETSIPDLLRLATSFSVLGATCLTTSSGGRNIGAFLIQIRRILRHHTSDNSRGIFRCVVSNIVGNVLCLFDILYLFRWFEMCVCVPEKVLTLQWSRCSDVPVPIWSPVANTLW